MFSLVRVALAVPLYHCFDYLIDADQRKQIRVGMRVKVPFGQRSMIGIVTELDPQNDLDHSKLKAVLEVLDKEPILSQSLAQLLTWAANYYQYPLGEVLFHALPVPLRQGKSAAIETLKVWQLTELGQQTDAKTLKNATKQQQLLQLLQQGESVEQLKQQFSSTIFQQLHKRELIAKVAISTPVKDWRIGYQGNHGKLQLNPEQQQAVSAIAQQQNQFAIWLLEGVTGSGKTEVYLHHLDAILAQGKQALILVPEISLTPQTINRFAERFQAPIDILHSGLTDNQRLKVWQRAKLGQNAIVIGTRSALFTPFQNLGTIVIDEEHDSSYKQQEGWRYHARDLAIVRAKLQQIPIILGSATPAMESLYNAQIGKYHHLKLTQRAGSAKPAAQHIIDIKGLPLTAGLAQPMLERMRHHLQNNNQVMLFLNRRGFAPRLLCHDCGWLAECPRCDRPYTYHQQQQQLSCHHCDSSRAIPQQCPHCGSTHLISLGVGTEQLERQLSQLFPTIPISRIDRDSTSKKGALEHYLKTIQQGGAQILVGTQILAKGHHFPDVTMVGILDVDGALFANDFRATERFAQLYTQVSGRAGRADKAGEVFLQTYHPEHPLLQTLLQHGYSAFAEQTLAEREATCLPPYSHQLLIRAADKNNRTALKFLQQIARFLSENQLDPHLWVLGPNPALQAKKAGSYRYQLLLQHSQRQQLQAVTQLLLQQITNWPESTRCRWSLDIDPQEF